VTRDAAVMAVADALNTVIAEQADHIVALEAALKRESSKHFVECLATLLREGWSLVPNPGEGRPYEWERQGLAGDGNGNTYSVATALVPGADFDLAERYLKATRP
jgi:hypothetical protein